MTPKSFFLIVLRLFGLYLLKDVFLAITELIASIFSFTQFDAVFEKILMFSFSLLYLLVLGSISFILIFKSSWIIDKLRLDKHFQEQQFSFNIHRSTVTKIAIILTAGIIVINAFPAAIRGLYLFYQERQMTRGMTSPDISFVIQKTCEILIGILIIYNNRGLTNFIEYKTRNTGG